MSMPITQWVLGVSIAGSVAIGTWGISTEVRIRDHKDDIDQNQENIAQALANSQRILNDLSYIRGKVDTIANQQQDEIK